MKKQKNIKDNIQKKNSLFSSTDKENFEFEEMVINADAMKVLRQLMKDNNDMTREQLAAKLNVTTAYISKLFSGKKYFNVTLLAKIQRIFKVRINVVTAEMIKQYKNETLLPIKMENKGTSELCVTEDGIIKLIPQNVTHDNSQKNVETDTPYSLAK